ncbi:MAG: hypothetical protein U0031_11600 [Thermomicrobiales bacterium]
MELAGFTLEQGISAFTLATDDAATIEVFVTEAAPQDLIAARAGTTPAVATSAAT